MTHSNDTILQTLAMVFPGQGSQSVGMLTDYAGHEPLFGATLAEASSALGYDMAEMIRLGPDSELNRTEITQPALLAAGIAVWRIWRERGGPMPAMLAGHSLGEYTALVAAGCLSLHDAVTLVRDRGKYMQEAVPAGQGSMAAVLGLDAARIETLCLEAAQGEVVAAVNFNSPEQTVIAGQVAAVERAMEAMRAAGAKRVVPLPVSVPSHCALMRPAADRLAERLQNVTMHDAAVPVIRNLDAMPHQSATELRNGLIGQLYQPVRWVDSIRRLHADGCTTVVECAPGKVLTGLIRRIDRDLNLLSLHDIDNLKTSLEACTS